MWIGISFSCCKEVRFLEEELGKIDMSSKELFNTFSVEHVVKDLEWKIVIEMKNKNSSSFYSKYFQEREREVFDLEFLFIGSISLTNRRAQHFPFHIVHHLYSIAQSVVVVTSSTKVINWKGCPYILFSWERTEVERFSSKDALHHAWKKQNKLLLP